MKRNVILSALIFWVGAVLNSAGASPGNVKKTATFVVDTDAPLITNVTADSETQLSSNCTWIVTDPGNDNYEYMTIGNYLAALIDGDTQTYWHSDPVGMNLYGQDEYIQADLKRTDITQFYYMLNRREDIYNGGVRHGVTPTTFEIKVTNTPNVASSWKTIKTVEGMPYGSNEDAWPYYSPLVEMGGAYRYVRFYCRASEGSHAYWCFSEFQMYESKEVTDPRTLLTLLVDSISSLDRSYIDGANPGNYPTAKVNAYNSALDEANLVANSAHTSDEYNAAAAKLRAAFADVEASVIPVTDGYYYIVSAYPGYENIQGVQKAFSVDLNAQRLSWASYDVEDPFQIFKISGTNDGNYLIQNLGSQWYIGSVEGDATVSTVYVPIVTLPTDTQTITYLGEGSSQFNLANLTNSIAYHTLGHQDGNGESGYIVPAQVGINSGSAWYLVAADPTLVERLKVEGEKRTNAILLQKAIDEAETVRVLANDYEALITEADDEDDAHNQFASNARWTYLDKATGGQGSFAALIDGSSDTYFHSAAVGAPGTYHYLQVDLKRTDISSFTFKMLRRGDGGWNDSWNQLPNNIVIYGTNDASALEESLPLTDGAESSWNKITTLSSGFPSVTSRDYYKSPVITMDQAYQYIRFQVRGTLTNTTDNTGLPFFNMSEFQMYNVIPTETSEYFTVSGMKEVCDELDALVAAGKEKVEAWTATSDDTTAIYAAIRKIRSLYVDRDVISSILKDKLTDAKATYQSAFTYDELITDAPDDGSGQITSSCLWMTPTADNGDVSYSSLIDNNLNTFFHSDPYPVGSVHDALNKSWAYLQFDLRRTDVTAFNFTLNGRVGANRATPNNIDIYVSNTPEDEDSWKKVTSLTKGFQGDISGAYYSSPDIQLNQAYQYIRIYVLGTSSSVVYFNIAELHMFNAQADKNKSQYYYVPGLKDADDNLLALINSVQAKIDNRTAVDLSDTTALNNAMKAVEALVYNTNDFTYLMTDAKKYVEHAQIGESVGQFEQTDVDALSTAIETAAAAVNYDVVDREAFETARTNLQTAINTFISKVHSIEPNKWYYIINAASEETYPDNNGKVLGVNGFSVGSILVNGNGFGVAADVTDVMYENDPYSMWRFVPIEGSEYYALQNLGTGHYVNEFISANANIALNNEQSPFALYYLGDGAMGIHHADSANLEAHYGLFGETDGVSLVDRVVSASLGAPGSWTIVPVETEAIDITAEANYIRSACYPFTIPAGTFGADGLNETFKAYGIRNITVEDEASKLSLYEITDEIPAGQPFILMQGDMSQFDSDNRSTEMFSIEFTQAMNVVDKADTANGLVGTLDGVTLRKEGLGYIDGNVLNVLPSSKSITLSGSRAWINPAEVQELTDKAEALVLTVDGKLDAVKPVVELANATVDVYSVDGKLLKRQVKVADATKNLKKGIYIVGKKKISVK